MWRLRRRRQAGPGAGQKVAQTLPSAVERCPGLPVLAPSAGFKPFLLREAAHAGVSL